MVNAAPLPLIGIDDQDASGLDARMAEVQESGTVGGWLKTVATNLSINHLNRYRARWRFFSEEEKEVEIPISDPPTDDRRELLELAIQKLPDAQRVPLVLFHFQD